MRQILAVFFMLVFAQVSFAQPNPDTLWTRTCGGSGDDWAYSVQQTTDGGYIVAGWTHSLDTGYSDFYLVKTNSLGDTLWTRTYGGSIDDFARCVQQTADGGYILAGNTLSFGAGNWDFYLVKTNSLGDTLWTRTYGGSDWDWAYSVQETADGGYIVAGHTESFGAGADDFYLIKTNSQGDTLWTRTYGGSSWDVAFSVRQTADGGYIVAGGTTCFGTMCFLLVRVNGQGDTLWTRTYSYGGNEWDEMVCVRQTADGGYILAGRTESFGAEGYDFYLLKTDSLGDTLWTRIYGGSEDEKAVSVQQTTDGGYVVAGWTESFGAGGYDFYLVKTNSQGDTLWTRTYGGSADERARSVQQTTDGGYIVVGVTHSFGAGHWDFYLVKTGPDIVSAEPLKNTLPANYALHPNWPNPFNPVTTIRYDVRKTGLISLRVFDLLGRGVAILVQGTIPAGSYIVAWDAADLPSGIYFCRMEAAGFVQTRKMLLVK